MRIRFYGWKAGALWEDVKFDVTHFSAIERLAIVGDKQWEKSMAVFCRPASVKSVSRAIVRALDQTAGRERDVARRYSWDRTAQELLRAYAA